MNGHVVYPQETVTQALARLNSAIDSLAASRREVAYLQAVRLAERKAGVR